MNIDIDIPLDPPVIVGYQPYSTDLKIAISFMYSRREVFGSRQTSVIARAKFVPIKSPTSRTFSKWLCGNEFYF
jgi:hypothetical protein